MAKQMILTCDFGDPACGQTAVSYRLWRDGDKQASAIDLCDKHAASLLAIIDSAELVDLPVKPRVRMEVTQLKTTARTAPLKKSNRSKE